MLERLKRMDRVLLAGDVIIIVGALAGSLTLILAGLVLVMIGFGRILAARRARTRD